MRRGRNVTVTTEPTFRKEFSEAREGCAQQMSHVFLKTGRTTYDEDAMLTLEEIESLFHELRSLPDSSERRAVLQARCGDDDALVRRLTDMLKHDSESHAILDDLTRDSSECASEISPKVMGPRSSGVESLHPGASIDHFTIVREIGRGGMGVVYEALQKTPIERRVAIKVMRRFANRSEELERRFLQEKRALSKLQHPNITTIFDAGVDADGNLYFVMELLNGTEITDYANTQRLCVAHRVELLEQVCQAIHHAHQRGILHLDIKPGNLVVQEIDDRSVAKVIDFGISEAIQSIGVRTDDTALSPTHGYASDCDDTEVDRPQPKEQRKALTKSASDVTAEALRPRGAVGTPCYMSPEHLRLIDGELDVRADVFSLGVVLYELVVGTCPLRRDDADRSSWREIVAAIQDCDWTLPGDRWREYSATEQTQYADACLAKAPEMERLLDGELGAVIRKCLQPNPDDRYESAAALARDLRAYLQCRPLDAIRPSFRYQSLKLVQRNRRVFVAIAVSAVLLIAFSVASTWLAIKNDRLRRLANRRADQLQIREEQLASANSGLKDALSRAVAAEERVSANLDDRRRAAAIERAGNRFALGRAAQPDQTGQNRFGSLPRLAEFGSEMGSIGANPDAMPQQFNFGGIPVQISNSSATVSVTTSPLAPQTAALATGLTTQNYLEALVGLFGGDLETLQELVAEELRVEFGEQHEIYLDYVQSIDTSP